MESREEKLKLAIQRSGVRHWEVARCMAISESTLSRLLRDGACSSSREKEVLAAIDRALKDREKKRA